MKDTALEVQLKECEESQQKQVSLLEEETKRKLEELREASREKILLLEEEREKILSELERNRAEIQEYVYIIYFFLNRNIIYVYIFTFFFCNFKNSYLNPLINKYFNIIIKFK